MRVQNPVLTISSTDPTDFELTCEDELLRDWLKEAIEVRGAHQVELFLHLHGTKSGGVSIRELYVEWSKSSQSRSGRPFHDFVKDFLVINGFHLFLPHDCGLPYAPKHLRAFHVDHALPLDKVERGQVLASVYWAKDDERAKAILREVGCFDCSVVTCRHNPVRATSIPSLSRPSEPQRNRRKVRDAEEKKERSVVQQRV